MDKTMKNQTIIEALEHYYEEEVFANYDRNKGGVKYSFDMLRKSIEIQTILIEIKKEMGQSIEENEKRLEKLKRYWEEDVSDPKELIQKLMEELETEIEWCPINQERAKERGWIESAKDYERRYQQAIEEMKEVSQYKIDDVIKITGEKPF